MSSPPDLVPAPLNSGLVCVCVWGVTNCDGAAVKNSSGVTALAPSPALLAKPPSEDLPRAQRAGPGGREEMAQVGRGEAQRASPDAGMEWLRQWAGPRSPRLAGSLGFILRPVGSYWGGLGRRGTRANSLLENSFGLCAEGPGKAGVQARGPAERRPGLAAGSRGREDKRDLSLS